MRAVQAYVQTEPEEKGMLTEKNRLLGSDDDRRLAHIRKNYSVTSRTSSAVTMAITFTPCSHTICQKSWHVCGRGPWVAM